MTGQTSQQRAELQDRSGLPAWTYFNKELFELEKDQLFRRYWQVACHVNDVPEVGNYQCFDVVGERALIVRDHDGEVRAFHNVCRHRGSRVVPQQSGRCKGVLVCPFHGWSFNLDGTLRALPAKKTFPEFDAVEHGLVALEFEIWHGFVFVRFLAGPQPSVAEIMAPYEEEIAAYRLSQAKPLANSEWGEDLEVNWKSVRDVDNEGYHVPIAHPSLHDLYGDNYTDDVFVGDTSRASGRFNDDGGRIWSVRHYRKILPEMRGLNDEQQSCWTYIAVFPNMVFQLYPDSIGYYQELPKAVDRTRQFGRVYGHEDARREMKLARYLSMRIDRDTYDEDAQLIEWSWEATKSSGYQGVILSDLEGGVRSYHDRLRQVLPVTKMADEPGRGEVAALNSA